jgi:SAM-dependent methyltransferase
MALNQTQSDMPADTDTMGPHEERRLLDRLERRPWRDGLAEALADRGPGLYARLTDPGQAAILSLLEIADGARCLDATGGWGQLAVPLARRARVVVLAPSAVRAAIVRRIAQQEGVGPDVAVGAPGRAAFAPAAFDVVLLHGLPEMGNGAASEPTALAALRDAARLLRPGGRLYLGAANDLADLVGGAAAADARGHVRTLARYTALFAPAGLALIAAYACFPDHEQPRFLVPLALVDDFVADPAYAAPRPAWNASTPAGTYARLAGEGIARHFAPSFAFILGARAARPLLA